jgi:PAS domain S-box-containing protein
MPLRPSSIKAGIRGVILLTSCLVLLASFLGFAFYEVVSFSRESAQHTATLAAVIADNSAAPLAFHNKENAQEILAALKAEPDITAAVLFENNGMPFASFPADLPTNQIPAKVGRGQSLAWDAIVLYRPILEDGKLLGTLYLHSSLHGLYVQLWRYAAIAALILAASITAAALLSSLLQRRITEPLLALTKTAQLVSTTEDYSQRAPKLSGDEVGVLADAFNSMLTKTQEHQSRLSEQARLLDLSFDAIIVLDDARRITYWNRGATEVYGYSEDEATGAVIDDFLKTEFSKPKDQILEAFHRHGRWYGELQHTRKDGSRIIVASRWSLDRDASGRPAGTLETNNDITDRKRAEREVIESEQRFRSMADNISTLAWIADSDGSIFFYNRRWYEYTGTTFNDMQGWGWDKVHHPDHLRRVTEKWKRHLSLGEPWEDTFPLRGRQGEFRWFLSRAFPIRDTRGNIARWFGTNTDITELLVTQRALESAQKELRDHAEKLEQTVSVRTARLNETIGELEAFSYSISHDMRAPLRAMTAYSKALLEDLGPKIDPDSTKLLQNIVSSATRMDQLITDVLSYSHVTRSERRLEPTNVDSLIEEIIAQFPELEAPAAEIEVQSPLPRVMGDRASLGQCISNLLTNAVKFVEPGRKPRITVRAEPSPAPNAKDFARFWFEDNGIGIAPQDLGRIFGIFERVHPRAKFEGTGIGLAIVRKAVERMGGSLGVESELGRGSRFWLELRIAG